MGVEWSTSRDASVLRKPVSWYTCVDMHGTGQDGGVNGLLHAMLVYSSLETYALYTSVEMHETGQDRGKKVFLM